MKAREKFVGSSWDLDSAVRLGMDIIQLTYGCLLPFHGSNRGSNPRGDAIKKTPSVSGLEGFSLLNPLLPLKRRDHESSRFVTLDHDPSRKITQEFVRSSWGFAPQPLWLGENRLYKELRASVAPSTGVA